MIKTTKGTPVHLVAKYCGMVYGHDREELPQWRKVIAHTDAGCGGVAILSYESGELFIVLRGTDDLGDWWKHNLRVLPKSYGDVLVHRGFRDAGVAAVTDLLSQVSPAVRAVYRTVFCGHSLGGAAAVVASISEANPHGNYEIVTFGAPRALFPSARRLVQATAKQVLLFGHESDIVFRCPPSLIGYRHASDVSFINRAGDVVHGSSAAGRKLDALRGYWVDITNGEFDALSDHAIRVYEDALK